MQPTELIEFLNDYLSQMTEIVLETKGSLDKYIGDAIVAFLGELPLPIEDHAYQACFGCCAYGGKIEGILTFISCKPQTTD